MTNYDTLKEYEAHKEPLPSYDEYKRLQEQLKKKDKLIEKLKKDKKDCKRCAFNCFHKMQSGV